MSNISMSELLITDGTKVVDLLNHFRLLSWQPVETPIRDGGIFQESPIADGRKMVARYHENGGEIFTLAVRTGHQNAAIADLRRLRGMFEQAANYWNTNWADGLVWIEARSGQETNRRYASIMVGYVPNDPPPYSEPFAGRLQTIGVIEVSIERGHWLDVQPGTDTAIPIGAIEESFYTYTAAGPFGDVLVLVDRDNGNVDGDLTNGDVFFSPGRWSFDNLTHVFINGAGANMLDNATDYTIMGNLGEYTYFGNAVNTAPAPYIAQKTAPLTNLVFTVDYIYGDVSTYQWEYYSNAASAWVAFTTANSSFDRQTISLSYGFCPWDETPVIGNPVQGSVVFSISPEFTEYLYDAKAATINGVSAYWLRVVALSEGASIVRPVQIAARPVYSVTWNFVEIQEDEVPYGDMDLLVRQLLRDSSWIAFASSQPSSEHAMYVGLRSVDRGEDFQITKTLGRIDAMTADVTPGTLTLGADSSYVTSWKTSYASTYIYGFSYYGGIAYAYNATQDDAVAFTWTLTSSLKNQYRGEYLCFLLCRAQDEPANGEVNFTTQIKIYNTYYGSSYALTEGEVLFETEKVGINMPAASERFAAVNMGTVKFPNDIKVDEDYSNSVIMKVLVSVSDDVVAAWSVPSVIEAPTLFFDRIVLIPSDEWLGVAKISAQNQIMIDSTGDPKKIIRGVSLYSLTGFYGTGNVISNGPAILHKNERQRLWFFNTSQYAGKFTGAVAINGDGNYLSQVYSANLYGVNRYKSMRGDS